MKWVAGVSFALSDASSSLNAAPSWLIFSVRSPYSAERACGGGTALGAQVASGGDMHVLAYLQLRRVLELNLLQWRHFGVVGHLAVKAKRLGCFVLNKSTAYF